jgi:threonine/homoserine/homoserine lactone efflux protein
VKLAGAAYLFYLGAKALLSAWRMPESVEALPADPERKRSCYLQGLLTNVLNPKVAAFYLAFLPQFIQPGDNVPVKSALLVGIHYGMGLVWLSTVAFSVGRMSGFLSRSRVRRWLDGVVGGVMMAFGLRLALARD